ncbi:MAG: PsbP-related protein [Acidimicrobiia bacterium]
MRTRTELAGLTIALALVAAACGSSSAPAAQKPSSGGPSSTSAPRGVDPNAPEVVAPGDIPDTQAFVPYTTTGYSFKVPEGWSQSVAGATTTFSDHYNTVTSTSASVAVAPTTTGVTATEVPTLRRAVPNFELVKVSAITRPAGAGVLVTYRAGSAPDAVTGKRVAIDVERYEFWHNGLQVTLTLSGARGSDNVDPWKTITDSFAWSA